MPCSDIEKNFPRVLSLKKAQFFLALKPDKLGDFNLFEAQFFLTLKPDKREFLNQFEVQFFLALKPDKLGVFKPV